MCALAVWVPLRVLSAMRWVFVVIVEELDVGDG